MLALYQKRPEECRVVMVETGPAAVQPVSEGQIPILQIVSRFPVVSLSGMYGLRLFAFRGFRGNLLAHLKSWAYYNSSFYE